MAEIKEVGPDLYLIKIPIPFPLRFTNCYAARGEDGWYIVDTGLNHRPGRFTWTEAMLELEIAPEDLKAVYLTHYHPDHYGLAGWFQNLQPVPVYMHPNDCETARRVWREGSKYYPVVAEFYTQNGMPEEMAQRIIRLSFDMLHLVKPDAELTPLSSGSEVTIGYFKWQALWTPGHSYGHICFYQPEHRWLLSGDMLLPTITSNVSMWPGVDSSPLQNFLQSLDRLAELNVELVLPAHGEPFHDCAARVREIKEHHDRRLEQVLQAAGDGATAFAIGRQIFERELSLHEERFALGEVLSHLEYLRAMGRVDCREEDGVVYYYRVK